MLRRPQGFNIDQSQKQSEPFKGSSPRFVYKAGGRPQRQRSSENELISSELSLENYMKTRVIFFNHWKQGKHKMQRIRRNIYILLIGNKPIYPGDMRLQSVTVWNLLMHPLSNQDSETHPDGRTRSGSPTRMVYVRSGRISLSSNPHRWSHGHDSIGSKVY